jgi:hypothetical protein
MRLQATLKFVTLTIFGSAPAIFVSQPVKGRRSYYRKKSVRVVVLVIG